MIPSPNDWPDIMGMYDTIMVACPKCGERNAFQTKGGDCLLDCWPMEDAPKDALENVNRHAPSPCEECGATLDFDMSGERPVALLSPSNAEVSRGEAQPRS